MSNLAVGQVLNFKMRFNNEGTVSSTRHPYIIADISEADNYIEVIQVDSLEGKEYKAAKKSNRTIYVDNPEETVLDKDSYVQLDNVFRIENFEGLTNYRRQPDKLSPDKLDYILNECESYQSSHVISPNKKVYVDREEFLRLNM